MSAKPKLTVGQMFEKLREPLQLEALGSPDGMARTVTTSEAASPGLVLAGYVGRFIANRVQVMGETEVSYVATLPPELRREILERYFAYPIPCVFVTKGLKLPPEVDECAKAAGVAVLRSRVRTSEFYRRLNPFLENEFAPAVTLHGSLADVFGVGLFFTGKSGIGKSECVLDLVERGHRLVADDLVFVSRRGTDVLIARGHELQKHSMEIRGVGIIDIPALFGIRAVRQQKRIEVVVQLEEWDPAAHIDRTGLDRETTRVLDVDLPLVRVPLNPGKNITVIAEVIAMSHLLRYSGVDTAEAFNKRLISRMKAAAGNRKEMEGTAAGRAMEEVRQYLQEDDE
jgi:HPr kinase/phosphorylase